MQEDKSKEIQAKLIEKHQQTGQNLINKQVEENKIPPASFMSLFIYTTPFERVLLIIGSIASIISGAGFPFFMLFLADVTLLFDEDNRGETIAKGWQFCWKLFIVGGATWISHFLGTYLWNTIGSAQSIRLKKIYYKTLLQQQVGWFDENDPYKLVTKVSTGITAIETATGEKISLLISTAVQGFGAIFLSFFICWQMSVMMLTALPPLMIGMILFMKSMVVYAQRQKVSYQTASSRTEQALGQIKTVKGLVGQGYQFQVFERNLQKGQQQTVKSNLFKSVSIGFVMTIFISIYAFGFWYGKKIILDNPGKYQISAILNTLFCFIMGGSSVGQISPFFKNIADGRVAMADFLQILSREKNLVQPLNGTKLKHFKDIQLKDVNFSYKQDVQVLKNINIKFKQGKVSAIVGQSGCGKSTIIQLLMRYYDCKSGNIMINNTNIKEIHMNNYRRKIGFVGQEPILFAISIAENLRLADPKLTDQQIIQALKKANAWEFVSKMDKRLDTYVGSGGAQLSGGQKQRIAIARAICKKPQLLILDEATSALDRKNERQIRQTLKNLQKNKITTIIIAHRLSTIKDADTIYVLNKGQLVETGNHHQLLQQNKMYAQLVKTQIAAEKNVQYNQQANISQHRQTDQQQKALINEQIEEKQKQKVVDEQQSKQKEDKVFKKLLAFSNKENLHLLIIGCIGAISSGLLWPFFNYMFSGILSLMIDMRANSDEIDNYCLYILLIAIGGGFMTGVYNFSFGLGSDRLVYNIRMKLFSKLLRLPASYYDKKENTAGAISVKLSTDCFQIHNMVSGVIGVMCLNFSTIVTSLFFGFYYSWKVTLISIALSPLIMVVGALNMKLIMKFTQKSQETQKFLGSLMNDSVCNIRTVKSLGRPKAFLMKFDQKLDQLNKINSAKHFNGSILSGMSKGMIMFVYGIIFYISAILFQDHQVESSRAIFTAVFSIIFAAMGVGQNSAFMPDMGKAKAAGVSIFDIIQTKGQDEISLELGGSTKQQLSHCEIQFKNVSFAYPQREKMVLENLSFKVENQKIALVGHSGSGKSTIVQLLMRFYDPIEGQILINGKNIKQIDLYDLRKQIGLVSQEPSLFMGSVSQNIKYNSECSQKDIEEATKIAHAHQFINAFQQGIQKQVGQKGTQVSGGQKQRIALSRCLVRKPNVFLFDEFTSALDADTQKIVFNNLKPVLSGKTSISVAHRLSTVEDCDFILVFKDGKIIQQGNYKELMELKSNFYLLAQGK